MSSYVLVVTYFYSILISRCISGFNFKLGFTAKISNFQSQSYYMTTVGGSDVQHSILQPMVFLCLFVGFGF